MSFKEKFRLKGFISIAFSGLVFGFAIGLFVIIKKGGPNYQYYLMGFSALGFLIGMFIAYYVQKKEPNGSWWQQPSASPELNNFQDRFIDKSKDDRLIAILPDLSDFELISVFIYQYYDLLNSSRVRLKKEILNRRLDSHRIKLIYEQNIREKRKNLGGCPHCGSNKYDSINCLICGFNHLRDNPELLSNRLKKIFGFYMDRKLSWNGITKHLGLDN